MAQITAAMVKQLREMTDSPMLECKKALVEADGDMDAAVDILRTNGLAAAAKKAGRDTNEGADAANISEDGPKVALAAIACETDFVACNAKYTATAPYGQAAPRDDRLPDDGVQEGPRRG